MTKLSSCGSEQLNFTRLEQTLLKLGIMCTLSPTHFVDLIGAVQSRYQGVELQLLDASAAELQEQLIKGELEIALYCLAGGQHEERLHYMPLFREQFMLVLPPNHRLAS